MVGYSLRSLKSPRALTVMRNPLCIACISLIALALVSHHQATAETNSTEIAEQIKIGREIFLDKNLSEPRSQACISCHDPKHAFSDPRPQSRGAVSNRRGTRNAPSLMYAALIPSFAYDEFFTPEGEEIYAFEGGLFWDGRARDLFEQVQKPFFHPNEMNLSNEGALASRLRASDYAGGLKKLVGAKNWQDDTSVTFHAYLSLVNFLQSPMFRPFDSKFDRFRRGNPAALNEVEKRGMKIYTGKGKCNDCHPLTANHWEQPLLSDFGFDNLGVPSLGAPDEGLGKHTGNAAEIGQFRSPSLRNVALTAPYMHNGSIASLREVVEFYNSRDTKESRWKVTDFPATVNRDDLGNLQLNQQEIDELVAFLQCFTDRCIDERPENQLFPSPPKTTASNESKERYFPSWTHRLHPEHKASRRRLEQDQSQASKP